jgi:CDP-glucose 4,6-dehydratase
VEGVGLKPDGFWTNRNVLVTGGTGLLGSWMVDALLERGARVTCLVRDEVPESRLVTSGAIGRINVVRGAVEDYETCLRALNEYEVDTVFHLAAQTIVGTAARSALSTFETNIRGTWTLLEACRELRTLVKRIVVASSDKAYGTHDKLPYKEDAPLQGRFPYDVSKSCADLIAISYAATHGLPIAITRCGNLYGGGDWNMSRIVPGTIRSLLSGERPIVRSTGKLVRDYFYVEDAVLAYIQLAEKMEAMKLAGEAFNFGTGHPMSVLEIVAAIRKAMNREDLAPEILGRNDGEIPAQYLDCTKARERLRWQPAFTLEEGLTRTIRWYRENP